MPDENGLILIKNFGNQAKTVSGNIEDRKDLVPHPNSIRVRIHLPNFPYISPLGRFRDSIPTVQWAIDTPVFSGGVEQLLPADDVQFRFAQLLGTGSQNAK